MAAKKKGSKAKAACKAAPAKTTQKKAQNKKAQELEALKKAAKSAAAKRRREKKKAAKLKAEKEAAKKEAAKRKAEKKAAQERAEKKKQRNKQRKARKAQLTKMNTAKERAEKERTAKAAMKKSSRSAQRRRAKERRNALKYMPIRLPAVVVPTVVINRPDHRTVVQESTSNVSNGSETKITAIPLHPPRTCPPATSAGVQAPAIKLEPDDSLTIKLESDDSLAISSLADSERGTGGATVPRMNRESSARDATHVEQTLPPGPNEEVAALSSKQKSPPSSARYGCVNVVASRADSPCLSSEPLDFNLPPSESLVGSKVSHTSSVRNPDSTEHVLPGTFMSAAVARAMINAEADRLFASHDLDAAIQAFRILPARYHDRLVDALVSSAVELDARGASIVSRLFQRGEIFEICGADALQAGFAPCAGALDELIVDFPDAKRIFFTIYDAAGLSCCEETSAGVQ